MGKLYAMAFGEKDESYRLDFTDGREFVEWTTVVQRPTRMEYLCGTVGMELGFLS